MARRHRGQIVGAGLAALWLLSAVLVDVALDPDAAVFVSLFGLSPLIAATVLPPGRTAGFAVAAVLAASGAGWWDGTWGTGQQAVRLADTILVSGVAVAFAALRVRQQRRYTRLVDIAQAAQRAILPTVPPVTGQVAVATTYLSATEDALVGGDLYDWYHSPERTRFLVGDVRGKGIDAVEQAARVIRSFRQYAATEPSLTRVAQCMDTYLRPHFDDEEFVTACLVEVAHDALTIVSCGHPPPLLVGHGGSASMLDPPAGLPLGLGSTHASLMTRWRPGDRLLLYTDGLSEARDARGRFLSPLSLAAALAADSVDDALAAAVDAVQRHTTNRRLTDDLAAILLQLITTTPWPQAVRLDTHPGRDSDVARLPSPRTRPPATLSPPDASALNPTAAGHTV